ASFPFPPFKFPSRHAKSTRRALRRRRRRWRTYATPTLPFSFFHPSPPQRPENVLLARASVGDSAPPGEKALPLLRRC
ncbi:hypothetical protein IscW_ISCW019812, partial [Ixodes scapularis]